MAAGLDVLHLDMDCFFAAVEIREDPSLAGLPVVVGGTGGRGVVASASYEARRFGVRSAMPTGEARRLCPRAVFLPGRHGLYGKVSAELFAICRRFTPLVEPLSLDEAFLDVSGAHALFGPSEEIARSLRRAVAEALSLTCSLGVARTKLVAKLASEAAKPIAGPAGVRPGAGVVVVEEADEVAFLRRHPLRAIPGIGPRTAARLSGFGISSVADLEEVGEERLVALLGAHRGRSLFALCRGVDPRRVEADTAARSIGKEETFEADIADPEQLASIARRLALAVAERCRSAGLHGRSVSVKVRHPDFSTVSRSRTLPAVLRSGHEIGDVACALLGALDTEGGIRLLGVSVHHLEQVAEATSQLSLFEDAEPAGARDPRRHERAEEVADAIRARFGAGVIGRLPTGRAHEPRAGDTR